MTASPAYPPTVRKWEKVQSLNGTHTDWWNDHGARLSMPMYVDLPNTLRKEILNGIRDACHSLNPTKPPAKTVSGITVASSSNNQPEIEAYLGMSLDVLRSVLFSRGGLTLDLVLRLQEVSGMEFVTEKDLVAAFKERTKQVKTYIAENKYDSQPE